MVEAQFSGLRMLGLDVAATSRLRSLEIASRGPQARGSPPWTLSTQSEEIEKLGFKVRRHMEADSERIEYT
jgi:hypothetical protein